jgi:hypothetical protein
VLAQVIDDHPDFDPDIFLAETVGFHHSHHLGLSPGGEEPGPGGDRRQVNGEHCALRAAGSGYGGGRRRSRC